MLSYSAVQHASATTCVKGTAQLSKQCRLSGSLCHQRKSSYVSGTYRRISAVAEVEEVAGTGVKLPATHVQASEAALKQIAAGASKGLNRTYFFDI